MSEIEKISSSAGLSQKYEPGEMEERVYANWIARGFFHADPASSRPRCCLTIPPPNVTGELHMGHALCYTIHDVLVRWKRMQGFTTLCLPGTDHAGIATQNVVERMLAAQGVSRHDLGRDGFIARVWEWKEKYGSTIIEQLKKLGCSFDWERERFTMDARYSDAVLEAFIHLFNKGYIYRGTRVTNWCPRCRTAISDIEADDEERASSLWHIRYPIENGYAFGTEFIVIATTRPETMLGDTAVAVHPDDPRYQALIGRHVILPLVGRRIPIIADPILVDMEFGTGALKVTPAHDFNDFEAGERSNLPRVTVIGPDGRMTEDAGGFAGMDRMDARQAIVEALEAEGLLVSVDDYTIKAPICDRCKTVLEPLLSEQWFCRMKELAAPAISAVKNGDVRFIPDRWGRVYLDWMERLRDWCVSRQLWWGHRIPVYHCASCHHAVGARQAPTSCDRCGHLTFTQDPDVLDTWFSSALWPFATLGWPERTPDLEAFYPTDCLITAPEIIYLWVARMIFSGLEFMQAKPFSDVYIYATVLDKHGDRMSKSKGNGINPLDLVSQFGADATRYGIVAQAGKAQQIRFSEDLVSQARNFCSKVWQSSRFVLTNLEKLDASEFGAHDPPAAQSLEDRWIFSRLAAVTSAVNQGLASYDLDVATRSLHEFVWNEFCDWYIELAKPRLASSDPSMAKNLRVILDTMLRLLHPFIPFLTEEIWRQLPGSGEALMVAEFPKSHPTDQDAGAEAAMASVIDLVVRIRNMRAELKVQPGLQIPVFLSALPSSDVGVKEIIQGRARCRVSVEDGRIEDTEQVRGSAISSSGGVRIRIPLEGLVDLGKERARLASEIASITREMEGLQKQLSNDQFISRAPAAIVNEKRERLSELEIRLQQAQAATDRIGVGGA